ncbi:MAG: 23S rRNA (uracil(1939)-C(5))-methyltransferase RlmD [Prevotellaceae bacterium]|jgi:23S rRNA (uracil1939-C5)-methyltransferase|nr:23S rRNA (uracil(1939)-C(5))-methyltransferase RlmD [Prevotellaceae bacterium]
MSKKKQNIILNNVEIIDIAAEGKAIAKTDGKILFVPYAVPGSIVDVQIVRKQRNFMEGKIINVVKQSDKFVNAFCEHFGVCGGCKWQNLPYNEQLFYKQKQVADQLQRIAKISFPQIDNIIASPKTVEYRNKLEFTFSNKRWITQTEIDENAHIENHNALGFHIPQLFDKVLNINHCHLQPEPSNEIRKAIYEFAIKNSYSFFDIREKNGFLRNLIIRNAKCGDIMVIVVFGCDDEKKRNALLDYLKTKFPQITSLQYVINTKLNDTINDLDVICYHGSSFLMEEMNGLKFKIAAKSFYQTNPEQVLNLYQKVFEFANANSSQIIYDLYTGTGTIALFLARHAKKVIGIEYIAEAIADAKHNAEINNIGNVNFYVGDMKDILTDDFINQNGKANVVILDPPRAGIHPRVGEVIVNAKPEKIVYVSCNPATQARDLPVFAEQYEIKKIQPVDMFPHTHHVENIVLLERK